MNKKLLLLLAGLVLAPLTQTNGQKLLQWNVGVTGSTAANNDESFNRTIRQGGGLVRIHPHHPFLGLLYAYAGVTLQETRIEDLDVRTPSKSVWSTETRTYPDLGIGATTLWWNYHYLPRLFPAGDAWIDLLNDRKFQLRGSLAYFTKNRQWCFQAGFQNGVHSGVGYFAQVSFWPGKEGL